MSPTPTPQWSLTSSLPTVCSPSFILSSLGFTAVAFVTGSLALWAPAFLLRSRVVLGETPPCLPGDSCSSSDRYQKGVRLGGLQVAGDGGRDSLIQTQATSSPSVRFLGWEIGDGLISSSRSSVTRGVLDRPELCRQLGRTIFFCRPWGRGEGAVQAEGLAPMPLPLPSASSLGSSPA